MRRVYRTDMTATGRRLTATLVLATVLGLLPGAVVAGAAPPPSSRASAGLPLGAAGLAETRSQRVLQRGVTVTTIVRGAVDARHF